MRAVSRQAGLGSRNNGFRFSLRVDTSTCALARSTVIVGNPIPAHVSHQRHPRNAEFDVQGGKQRRVPSLSAFLDQFRHAWYSCWIIHGPLAAGGQEAGPEAAVMVLGEVIDDSG